LLDVLDKELQRKGLRFVRYADDFSLYAKSKVEAKKLGNEVYMFLKEKLDLPINRAKSGIWHSGRHALGNWLCKFLLGLRQFLPEMHLCRRKI